MKKLLLLDADVVIDLHSLGLFDKICKSYSVHVTREVLREAKYYKKKNRKIPIQIEKRVSIIKDVRVESLAIVQREAKEARLAIDAGEATSIAYILQAETDMFLCLCDKAAITLMSFLVLEERAISLEKALREAGHRSKLYPRHLESTFKTCIKEGKTLRIQFKKLI
jgi:hypothetical protein